jgi:hypothetical protein
MELDRETVEGFGDCSLEDFARVPEIVEVLDGNTQTLSSSPDSHGSHGSHGSYDSHGFDPEVFEMLLGAKGSLPSPSFLASLKYKRERRRAPKKHFKCIVFEGKVVLCGMLPVVKPPSRNSLRKIEGLIYDEDSDSGLLTYIREICFMLCDRHIDTSICYT